MYLDGCKWFSNGIIHYYSPCLGLGHLEKYKYYFILCDRDNIIRALVPE